MKTVASDLFIAYNLEQVDWVHALATALEDSLDVREEGRRRRFRCFYYSVDMRVGQDWHANMLLQAAAAARFLFVASLGSLVSRDCMHEVYHRIQQPHGLETALFVNRIPGKDLCETPVGVLVWFRLWEDVSDDGRFDEHVRTVSDWLCSPQGDQERHEVVRRSAIKSPGSLLEAARNFLPVLGVVLEGGSTVLGCAWRTCGAQFRCATVVARAVQRAVGQRRGVAIRWYADGGSQPIDLPVTHVCLEEGPHLGSRLVVSLSNRLPKPPPTTGEPQFFDGSYLGTWVHVHGRPVPCAVRVAGWHQPGATLLAPPDDRQPLEGGALFDAHGCLAGCLLHDGSGQLFAVPFDALQPQKS